MSQPFKLARSVADLRPDAILHHAGFQTRVSFVRYAEQHGLAVPRIGDKMRIYVDPETSRIGLRFDDRRSATAVDVSGPTTPMLNRCAIAASVEAALKREIEYWSVVEFHTDSSPNFIFEPFEDARRRLRSTIASLPALLAGAGFRPARGAAKNTFMGEDHTLLVLDGRMVALRAGRECAALHVCAPFVTDATITKWAQKLSAEASAFGN